MEQLWRTIPAAVPFSAPPPTAGPLPAADPALGTESAPLAAVLVLSDPANWYTDAQLICDVVGGRGVPTRQEPAPGDGVQLCAAACWHSFTPPWMLQQ